MYVVNHKLRAGTDRLSQHRLRCVLNVEPRRSGEEMLSQECRDQQGRQ